MRSQRRSSLAPGPLLGAAAVRVERDLPVPMRDGVVLRADVLRPEQQGRFPALLVRTPYGKKVEWGEDDFAVRAARAGYVVVVQDVRGRYASEGVFDPYRQEGRDGFDTIAWVAGLPSCDGQVGLTGLSYPAAVQWLAAAVGPPQLKAMAPAMTFSSGRSFCYFGGAFDLSWLRVVLRGDRSRPAPPARPRRPEDGRRGGPQPGRRTATRGCGTSRCARDPALAGVAPAFFEWLDHPDDGPFWDFLRIDSHYDRRASAGAEPLGLARRGLRPGRRRRNFAGTREWGGRLVIGPWTHGTPTPRRTRVAELDFGSDAGLDYEALLLRFFDRWLKGVPNGDRPRGAGADLRDGRERLARRGGVAAAARAADRVSPARGRPADAQRPRRVQRGGRRLHLRPERPARRPARWAGSVRSTRARSRSGGTCSPIAASRSRATSRRPGRSRWSYG